MKKSNFPKNHKIFPRHVRQQKCVGTVVLPELENLTRRDGKMDLICLSIPVVSAAALVGMVKLTEVLQNLVSKLRGAV